MTYFTTIRKEGERKRGRGILLHKIGTKFKMQNPTFLIISSKISGQKFKFNVRVRWAKKMKKMGNERIEELGLGKRKIRDRT